MLMECFYFKICAKINTKIAVNIYLMYSSYLTLFPNIYVGKKTPNI